MSLGAFLSCPRASSPLASAWFGLRGGVTTLSINSPSVGDGVSLEVGEAAGDRGDTVAPLDWGVEPVFP